MGKKTRRYFRFQVIEYASGYAVRDKKTGKEAWMSDGVDALWTKSGKPMRCGSEYFRRKWTEAMNDPWSDTLEAYWGR